jgi:His-Xaa-Ser system radical SAM maturase HxsB
VEPRSLTLSPPDVAADSLGFFRWGRVAGKVLVTNDAADWAFLTETEFDDLLAGRVVEGHPRFAELQRKGFVRDGLDLDALATRIAQRSRHIRRGPHVHVVTLTLRRSHAGANGQAVEEPGTDMSSETAETIVELALQGASPSLTFELRGEGGEPLLNVDVLRHLVEFARTRNERAAGKTLRFRVLTNFTAMSEEAAEWLIANDVLVSTTLDGPAGLHDDNRQRLGGSPHADVVHWIEYFQRRYAELGRDPQQWNVDALMNTTRRTLAAWREVVDEYVARGIRTIHVRALDSHRFDDETWAAIGYTTREYLDFYRRALDYVLELNRGGGELTESLASIILTKILTSDDPGAVDIQSPYGAGTGQIAYNVDGRVFPCDEARAVDATGDPIFELGHVRNLNVQGIARHPTVRAIAAASLLDAQPMCADCWNKPFCGYSPVRNFVARGDLFGQRPGCFECEEHLAVSTQLFELLADEGDARTREVLQRWAAQKSPHVIDGRAAKEAP